ncbi:DUF1127 domain-containing protein [Roseomonas sp. E05]|uniref:DUF1127 domain-containing protein n=1 Tax=Roseomonas sp. E05 TaxID=3046310 RepID=UPI0024BB5BD5|nr:DUF1127 domain-containing protein [Roseomonas sp. E05]MDJ0389115.1 DUF1127 domain-containing protein [Roseomonas sp. E05]
MSALATPLPRLARPAGPPAALTGPRGEGIWARSLRWIADHRHLREMDERLLRDIGLTRADVARGLPFRR